MIVCCIVRKPMAQPEPVFVVDHKLAESPWYSYPVLLCFGFGLDSDVLVNYALKHKLTDEKTLSEGTVGRMSRMCYKAMMDAQRRLKKASHAARLHLRFPYHVDADVVFRDGLASWFVMVRNIEALAAIDGGSCWILT